MAIPSSFGMCVSLLALMSVSLVLLTLALGHIVHIELICFLLT
jgi:hypothetical protein